MADPAADWISLNKSYYKINEFFKMSQEFRSIEIEHCLVAVARHGGPIAITRNPAHIVISKATDPTRENICMFSNNGEMMSLIPLNSEKSNIVGFDFIEDESLVVVFEEAIFFVIDPFLGTNKVNRLGGRHEQTKIVEAKMFDNGFAFYNTDNDFFYLSNVHEPQVHKFLDPQIVSKPSFFLPISAKNSNSERIELQVTHSESGVVVVVENESSKLYYNQLKNNAAAEILPTIPGIVMIAISPGHKLVAYLTKDKLLHVVSADLSSNTHIETSLKYEKLPKSLVWCAEDCVCLVFEKYMLIVTHDQAVEKINFSNKGCHAYPEVDGVKLISNNRCEILRKLPES